jgi:hypothetical protein
MGKGERMRRSIGLSNEGVLEERCDFGAFVRVAFKTRVEELFRCAREVFGYSSYSSLVFHIIHSSSCHRDDALSELENVIFACEFLTVGTTLRAGR